MVWRHFSVNKMDRDRALFALEQARAALPGDVPDALKVHLNETLARYATQRQLEEDYAAAQRRSTARGDARRLDADIDQLLVGMYRLCEGYNALNETDPRAQAAAALQLKHFPDGIGAVVRLAFEKQLRAVEILLADAEAQGWFATLGFEPFVEALTPLVAQFRVELERSNVPTVAFADVKTARDAAHQSLLKLIAGLAWLRPDDADTVLAALEDQIKRQRAAAKAGRNVTVDPQTGAETEVVIGEFGESGEPEGEG